MSLTTTPLSSFLMPGESVGAHVQTEYTVSQAASFLRTSERHLNDLLESGRIAFRQENGKRLVQRNSMLDYEQWRERGHAWLDEMVRMNQEMGLYDD